jgi:regulator of protease activity HflC (stomatin/prohibitin superfamily)
VRRLDFGQVHDIALSTDPIAPASPAGAEDAAVPAADRLWDLPQPGEITLAIAGTGPGQQNVQSVSADLHLLYRAGLSDQAALASTYSTADQQALVRAMAGRVVAADFAARTLEALLGENRAAMAERLRAAVQAQLDRAGSGIDLLAVVIEAIHPPAGVADAYHAVPAAETMARAELASAHGNAIALRSQARQSAAAQLAAAQASAAETVGAARADLLRFTADRDAARSAGKVFLLERYLSDLSGAIGKTPKTIIDHRLNWPEAPVLDLRPITGALPIGDKGE